MALDEAGEAAGVQDLQLEVTQVLSKGPVLGTQGSYHPMSKAYENLPSN